MIPRAKSKNRSGCEINATRFGREPSTPLMKTDLIEPRPISGNYRDHDDRKWTNFFAGIEPGEEALWKLVKPYTENKYKMPPLITENRLAYKDIEKAEAIADSLQMQFKNNDLSHPHPPRTILSPGELRF
ncbi:hypothetical protein AVEN_149356-1 [Araneus ventricosus]|uniref:Uncharacterized protein n=1 Tax=Araneus ventricosus TaxID=182803 RepID=A0A4Y2R6J5_ARAVE|nr:hypothetical protein AVEN_149356-1 [Araneus ventricosus]